MRICTSPPHSFRIQWGQITFCHSTRFIVIDSDCNQNFDDITLLFFHFSKCVIHLFYSSFSLLEPRLETTTTSLSTLQSLLILNSFPFFWLCLFLIVFSWCSVCDDACVYEMNEVAILYATQWWMMIVKLGGRWWSWNDVFIMCSIGFMYNVICV